MTQTNSDYRTGYEDALSDCIEDMCSRCCRGDRVDFDGESLRSGVTHNGSPCTAALIWRLARLHRHVSALLEKRKVKNGQN